MELNWVKINGFKRFENATLNTSGKVIAILGPNEAGKSSLLQALVRLNDDNKFAEGNELTRTREEKFSDDHIVLEAGFILNDEDRQAISHVDTSDSVQWFYIKKPVSGKREFNIEQLGKEVLEQAPEDEKGADLRQKIIDILKQRVPKFLLFDDKHRDLPSQFNLSTSNKNELLQPTQALKNLLKIADLDIQELSRILNEYAIIKSKLNKANDTIAKIYEGKWSQSNLKLVIDVNSSLLSIFIENKQLNAFEPRQRSDGLRQFVALINFLEVEHAEQPILLVDEAELHLHYDAQADLIKMFTQQKFASKIIYTTHSIGCLPEDLGTGVKLVCPQEDETSKIEKNFWSVDKGRGILPLLFGMGASNLAFIAIRESVIVEGPTDMLLLPTLFRQATKKDHLGFQFVQGIAMTKNADFGLLENHGSKVVFLVDNDEEGEKYKEQLEKAGIEDGRIFQLPKWGNAKVLEDYIRKDLYLKTVNEQIRTWNGDKQENLSRLLMKDITDENRPKAVETWCKEQGIHKIDKISIVYYLLDLVIDEKQEKLIEDGLEKEFTELYDKITKLFSR